MPPPNNTHSQYPKGEYCDTLYDVTDQIVWQTPWRSNLIVNGLSRLLAALVKGDEAGDALAFWAVGIGNSDWDTGTNLPNEDERRNFTTLVNETGRKVIEPNDIIFFPSGSLSNQIEISVQFTAADIASDAPENRQLREFGLFAGGTTSRGTGRLINHRIHARIDLEDAPLERVLRLTF